MHHGQQVGDRLPLQAQTRERGIWQPPGTSPSRECRRAEPMEHRVIVVGKVRLLECRLGALFSWRLLAGQWLRYVMVFDNAQARAFPPLVRSE